MRTDGDSIWCWFLQVLDMTDKLGDKLGLKLSRIEPALYDEMDDQVKTPCILFRFITGYMGFMI